MSFLVQKLYLTTARFYIWSVYLAISKLAPGKWFTIRVSSCGLLHIAHSSAPDQLKGELRTSYDQLCQDDMPMVRRAAASNLMKFAATVEHNHLKTAIISIFDDLTRDAFAAPRDDIASLEVVSYDQQEKLPFVPRHRQFPVRLCYAITTAKPIHCRAYRNKYTLQIQHDTKGSVRWINNCSD